MLAGLLCAFAHAIGGPAVAGSKGAAEFATGGGSQQHRNGSADTYPEQEPAQRIRGLVAFRSLFQLPPRTLISRILSYASSFTCLTDGSRSQKIPSSFRKPSPVWCCLLRSIQAEIARSGPETTWEAAFEVKFLVRLKAAAQQQVWPPVFCFIPQEGRQDSPISKTFQGESSTHGDSSNPDASGDDYQTQQ